MARDVVLRHGSPSVGAGKGCWIRGAGKSIDTHILLWQGRNTRGTIIKCAGHPEESGFTSPQAMISKEEAPSIELTQLFWLPLNLVCTFAKCGLRKGERPTVVRTNTLQTRESSCRSIKK